MCSDMCLQVMAAGLQRHIPAKVKSFSVHNIKEKHRIFAVFHVIFKFLVVIWGLYCTVHMKGQLALLQF